MARKPNYQFERSERERQKANKAAAKAAAKRESREGDAAPADRPTGADDGSSQD
ncbi:MAG: hypothetical protein JWQ97_2109 [Phenylobacterium sp.]|nr:hypothetical protein [Phenylobacterium sp.]